MTPEMVFVIVFAIANAVDVWLYCRECRRRGPLNNFWVFSGYYEWLKGRK